jgi:putative membrane protein
MDKIQKPLNKDLILRENLALQRTILANQSTFLSFLRTSMYFLVAGLSINNIFQLEEGALIYQITFYTISVSILAFGIYNYHKQKRKINESKAQIGNYKFDYEKEG